MENSVHVYGFSLLTIDSHIPTSLNILPKIVFNECVEFRSIQSRDYKHDDCGPQKCFIETSLNCVTEDLVLYLKIFEFEFASTPFCLSLTATCCFTFQLASVTYIIPGWFLNITDFATPYLKKKKFNQFHLVNITNISNFFINNYCLKINSSGRNFWIEGYVHERSCQFSGQPAVYENTCFPV